MTAAKIGRSMKKCEKRISACRRLRSASGRSAPSLGVDLAARPGPHQAVDDDPVVGPEPAPHDRAGRPAGWGRARSASAGRRCRHRRSAPTCATGRCTMAESGISMASCSGEPGRRTPAELAGRDQAVRVGKHRPAADRAAALVDDVVDEVHLALMRPAILVDQMGRRRGCHVARRLQRALARQPLVAQEVALGRRRSSGRSGRAARSWSAASSLPAARPDCRHRPAGSTRARRSAT